MRKKKEIDPKICERLRHARERAKYTREKMAEYVNCSSSMISEFERGNSGISMAMFKRYCEVLGVSADSILWGDDSPEKIDISKMVMHLDPKYYNQLVELVRVYLQTVAIKKISDDESEVEE